MSDYYTLSPDEQAKRLEAAGHDALRQWGTDNANLSLIKHRENAVFEVDDGGHKSALRIHRHGYHSDDALRSELQWMQALSDAGVNTPVIIPTSDGEPFITYAGDGLPGALQIDRFEWIDGEQLGTDEEDVDLQRHRHDDR